MSTEEKTNRVGIPGTNDGTAPTQSNYPHLNAEYGDLNPLFESYVTGDPSQNEDSAEGFFNNAVKLIQNSMESDILNHTGQYIGVVLRVESDPSELTGTDNNWLTRAHKKSGTDSVPPLLAIRVRIPELHAPLPIPVDLPGKDSFFDNYASIDGLLGLSKEASGTGLSDDTIIKMYPVFTCQDTVISAFTPQPGSLVRVTFVDKQTQTGGIYLGPIDYNRTSPNSLAAGLGSGSPQAAFMGGAAGVGQLPTNSTGGDFSYNGTTDLPPGTPPSATEIRNKIIDFRGYRPGSKLIREKPERLAAAYYIYDRMVTAFGWTPSYAAAALVQAGGESGMNPDAIENKHKAYPNYGPGFGLFQITNGNGLGAALSLNAVIMRAQKLPQEVKDKFGIKPGEAKLPDIDENGNLVTRDVSYLADREAGDLVLSNANPAPPLRNGKKVQGYFNCNTPRNTMDRLALSILQIHGKGGTGAAYNDKLTAAQCFDKFHWSPLGGGSKSVFVKKANAGSASALATLERFSRGGAKRQRSGLKWLGESLWGSIGPYADERNPIVLDKGQKLNVPSQQPVVYKTNYPTKTENTGNSYSSTGGFLLSPRSTLGGIEREIYDDSGNKININSKILNRGFYKVDTRITLIPSKNVEIKPSDWHTNQDIKKVRTNRVRPYSYGNISKFSQNLVNVPTARGIKNQKIHILAAKRFELMNSFWLEYLKSVGDSQKKDITGLFRISQGYIRHKYKDDYQYYYDKMKEKYGSIEVGKRHEYFHSPYETGLVFDIGNNGFLASNQSLAKSNLEYYTNLISWNWLASNAHIFGIYPSGEFPWRWEVLVPRYNWFTGNDFVIEQNSIRPNMYKNQYAFYVIEESIESGLRTSDIIFDEEIFF